MRFVTVAVAAALLALGQPALAETTAAPAQPGGMLGQRECAVPARVARISGTLPRTKLRLRDHGPIKIVAIGSSSTEGVGASDPANCYPRQLERELARRFPMSAVAVINKGVGGELARDMVARLSRDAIEHRPQLVIWQTGVNDALHGIPGEVFRAELREGIARLSKANIDVLILDPQYTPRVAKGGGSAVYLGLFATLDRELGVAVFHRQAVMRHWVQGGGFTFASMLSSDSFHMNDRSYRCLAMVLADAIERLARD